MAPLVVFRLTDLLIFELVDHSVHFGHIGTNRSHATSTRVVRLVVYFVTIFDHALKKSTYIENDSSNLSVQ